jgi:hypothetical protein
VEFYFWRRKLKLFVKLLKILIFLEFILKILFNDSKVVEFEDDISPSKEIILLLILILLKGIYLMGLLSKYFNLY